MGRKNKSRYKSNGQSADQEIHIAKTRSQSNKQQFTLVAVIVVSFITRFYDIHEPAHVCWDETHFGKMASWYINRTFFFDVHPPLGKMLIALSGSLTGYDGSFAFEKPGDKFDNWSQYVGMRAFCASLGMFIPVFIYSATHSITRSYTAAIFAATLILFDNGIITLTRYILLDPPLLLFISASVLGLSKVSFELGAYNGYRDSFSRIWWFWLAWTGVSIAGATSVKFVGLLIVTLVGLRVIHDLWDILGDTSRGIDFFVKHFLARALCLILLPIVIYCTSFWVHLKQLDHSGSGDGFYSSAFQSQLIGNSLHNSSWPVHLAYGSEVTIKSNRIGGAYLHSHWHLYPEGVGARQQQVTTYSHKDSNNKWLVKRAIEEQPSGDNVFVRDGDLIRLEHILTKRNLHSHFVMAPITKRHYQVTCYGENGIGDANDVWRIHKEKISVTEKGDDDRILTVRTRFRLVHLLSGCALHSHSKQLPKWAYDQLEVTCNPKLYDKNNYWNIEDNYYPSLPNVSFEAYAPSFFDRFIESHAVMLQGNAGLKPKEGEITSRPWQWPINYRGQFFSASKGQRVYLLGNPIIWWANIVAIPVSVVLVVGLAVSNRIAIPSQKRPKQTSQPSSQPCQNLTIESTYLEASSWILVGWLVHYVPFFFMGRILYFHHYFPAFIFSCMLTAVTFDYIISVLARKLAFDSRRLELIKLELFLLPASVVIYTYFKFFPITYGTKTDNSYDQSSNHSVNESWRSEQQLSSLKWLDSWEF